MLSKKQNAFTGTSYPYNLREIFYINGHHMYQTEKREHLAYFNLSLLILVPTTEGHPSLWVTPIQQDGYQYSILLLSGILELLRLVVILKNTHKLYSFSYFFGPEQFERPKVKQYKVKSVYIQVGVKNSTVCLLLISLV